MMPERARKKKGRRSNLIFLFASFFLGGHLAGCGPGEEDGAGKPANPEGGQPPAAESDRRAATLELEATYPEGFSFLNGVRELPDGRVLAADPLAQILLRIDLDASTADTLGRLGPGPQEYEQPDQVFPPAGKPKPPGGSRGKCSSQRSLRMATSSWGFPCPSQGMRDSP